MASSPLKLNPSFTSTTLAQEYATMALATEDGGNTAVLSQFSGANGNSTYAFGLYQYDVGHNASAQTFLSSVGFTATQIAQLSQNSSSNPLSASTLASLNSQLATALQDPTNAAALDQLNANWFSNQLLPQLQGALDNIYQTNPAIADQIYQDPALQLRLIDYANQFGLSSNGQMSTWLANQPAGTVLTGGMIQQQVMSTAYAVAYPTSETTRETALNNVLSNNPDAPTQIDVSANFSGSIATSQLNVAAGVQATVYGWNDTFVMGEASTVNVTGTGDVLQCTSTALSSSVTSNGTVSATCSAGALTMSGDNALSEVTAGSSVTYTGVSNTMTLDDGASIAMVSSGSNALICGTGTSQVSGSATVSCSAGNITISGTGNSASTTNGTARFDDAGGTLVASSAGASVTTNGDNTQVTVAAGSTVTSTGNGVVVNDASGGGTVNINGSNGVANVNGDMVNLNAGTGTTLNGSNNTVGDTTAADNIYLNGTGNTANVRMTRSSSAPAPAPACLVRPIPSSTPTPVAP